MKIMLRNMMVWALTLACVLPVIAADDNDEDRYEQRVKQLNAMGEQPGTMKIALQRISTETGVPLERVQNQHKKYPDVGVAGLMLANVMASDTKKTPAQFLEQRVAGKKWLKLAKENKIPVERLNERLDRLERAMKGTL